MFLSLAQASSASSERSRSDRTGPNLKYPGKSPAAADISPSERPLNHVHCNLPPNSRLAPSSEDRLETIEPDEDDRMTILRRIAALCILNLSFASGALGSTIQYSIDSGATLQLGSGPIEVLTGGLTIECPVENCISNGEVDFDIVSIDLQSLSFSETQSGLFEFVGTPSGGGFSIGRFLTLFDAGSISTFPTRTRACLTASTQCWSHRRPISTAIAFGSCPAPEAIGDPSCRTRSRCS